MSIVTPSVRHNSCPERADLLDLLARAEQQARSIRDVLGITLLASGAPTPETFEERSTGAAGGILATHYAETVLGLARRALTTHPAGSLEPHLLGFAESIARSVLNEYRPEATPARPR